MKRSVDLLLVLCILAGALLGIANADETAAPPTPSVETKNGQPRLVVQMRHSDSIEQIAVSPDGRTLASVAGKELKLWDVATGLELRTQSWDSGVAFSPDGRLLAGITKSGIELHDTATGQTIRTVAGLDDNISTMAFSPDGRTLATGGDDNSVKLWDFTTGQALRVLRGPGEKPAYPGEKPRVNSVAFSPDGRILASGGTDKIITLWDVATGKNLRTLSSNGTGYSGVIWIAFTQDGRTLALIDKASSVDSRAIILWDVATGQERQTLGKFEGEVSVALSSDGRTFAATNHNHQDPEEALQLWDLVTGRQLRTMKQMEGHEDSSLHGRSVAFTPDGRIVAAGGSDQTITLWDTATGQVLRALSGSRDEVYSLAISPEGKMLAASSWVSDMTPGGAGSNGEAGLMRLWNLTTGQLQGNLGERIFSKEPDMLAFAPNSRQIVSGNWGGATLWDVTTGRQLLRFEHEDTLFDVTIAPDGKSIAAGFKDGCVKVWDSQTGHERLALGDDRCSWVRSVAFSPDGRKIAAALFERHRDALIFDTIIVLWDVASGKKLRTIRGHVSPAHENGEQVNSVAFSPDGRTLASGSVDKTIKLWDVATGKNLRTLTGHGAVVWSVRFSPDGRTLASGSDDRTVKLWDTGTGRELRTLSGHRGNVKTVAFSPDGRMVFSGSTDMTIRLWRTVDGAHLATLIALTDGGWVITDPQGRFDTGDLEEIKGVHWVLPNDPYTPVAIEAFMKDYFEPRLLPRILNGETFKPIGSLTSLNTVQPLVKIASVQREGTGDTASVTVEVAKDTRDILRDGKPVPMTTGVHDVKLFRDGQLVGFREGNITLDQSGKATLSFPGIRLPIKQVYTRVQLNTIKIAEILLGGPSVKKTEFSAYAFNDDGVKSATSRTRFAIPADLTPAQGRAYLITVGVDRYQNADWNLHYAASDAQKIRQSLETRLPQASGYADLVAITLTDEQATKENLKTMFDLLAGHHVPAEARQRIPNANRLAKATPEDLLILSFSGHGHVDERGIFYTFTHDTGPGAGKSVTPELLGHIVSSDDLSRWLRDVDAGDMAMIVDACHSAATVGEGFKPGPMGSRGLGQLAYDKGMRILAASQADDVALESDKLRQGLLTYALTHDGIEAFQADFKPTDRSIILAEWLAYGVERVPTLYAEIGRGQLSTFGRGAAHRGTVVYWGDQGQAAPIKHNPYQTPALFDFTRKQRAEVKVALSPGPAADPPKVRREAKPAAGAATKH